MKIVAPRNKRFENLISQALYKKIGGQQGTVVFEGVFALRIDREALKLHKQEFIKFCQSIKVENGNKRRMGNALYIEPQRTRKVTFRLSEEEYELLKKDAEDLQLKPSEYIRKMILSILAKRLGM